MFNTTNFKKKLLAAAIASHTLAGLSTTVFAQENTSPPEVEEVLVTGIKASLERSVDIKRNSDQMVEAITADDIGKMPDQNIADSLQRVPGVQIDRSGGEGTKVRIRGLGQNVTLLNGEAFVSGMEYYQSGEGRTEYDGSLEGVPSELLGGVEIIKTPKASDIEGALGGIINLKTRSPLSLKDPLMAIALKADYGDVSKDMKPSGTVVIGNAWENFGAILSLTSDDKTVHVDEAQNLNRNSFGWLKDATGKSYVAPGMLYNTDKELSRKRIGTSLALAWAPSDASEVTLDWFHSKLTIDDRSYSIKYTQNTDGGALLEGAGYSHTIDGNGVLTSGTFSTSGENNGYRDITTIDTDNLKLGSKVDLDRWHLDGAVSWAKADLEKNAAFGDARYQPYGVYQDVGVSVANPTGWKNFAPNVVVGDTGARNFSFSQGSSGIPTVMLSPAALAAIANPGNFLYKSHWAFGDRATNDSLTFAANAKYDLEIGDIKDIKFGIRSSDNEVDFVEGHYQVDLSTKINAQGVATSVPDGHNLGDIDGDGISDNQTWGASTRYVDANISNPAFGSVTSTGKDVGKILYGVTAGRWDGNAPGVIPWHTYNQMPEYYVHVKNFFPSGNGVHDALFTDPAKMGNAAQWLSNIASGEKVNFLKSAIDSWNVKTKTKAVYLETDLKGDIGVPYNLNVGVRVVKTDVTTSGGKTGPNDLWYGTDSWNGPLLTADTYSVLKSYTNALPSTNLTLDIADDQKVRASLAKVIARPNDQSLGHGASFSFTRNDARGGYEFVNGTVGNPLLDPYQATQVDVTYEWYFDDLSYFSAAVFYKNVSKFEATKASAVSVKDSTTIDLPGKPAGSSIGQVTSTINGSDAKVQGAELSFQKGFENGFGFGVNYTRADSKTSLGSASKNDLALPGISKNSFNVVGFYEAHGLHARIAYSWRDEFLSPDYTFETIGGVNPNSTGKNANIYASYYDAYGQVDFSVSYDVTDKLSFSLDGINVLSAEQRRYIEYSNFFRSNTASEARYTLGAKYQF